jgi:hypothetical protein
VPVTVTVAPIEPDSGVKLVIVGGFAFGDDAVTVAAVERTRRIVEASAATHWSW